MAIGGKLPCGIGHYFLRRWHPLPQIPFSPVPKILRLSLLRLIGSGFARPRGHFLPLGNWSFVSSCPLSFQEEETVYPSVLSVHGRRVDGL